MRNSKKRKGDCWDRKRAKVDLLSQVKYKRYRGMIRSDVNLSTKSRH